MQQQQNQPSIAYFFVLSWYNTDKKNQVKVFTWTFFWQTSSDPFSSDPEIPWEPIYAAFPCEISAAEHIVLDKSDLKYFHSVEPQNRLRLPHIAKTHFFIICD